MNICLPSRKREQEIKIEFRRLLINFENGIYKLAEELSLKNVIDFVTIALTGCPFLISGFQYGILFKTLNTSLSNAGPADCTISNSFIAPFSATKNCTCTIFFSLVFNSEGGCKFLFKKFIHVFSPPGKAARVFIIFGGATSFIFTGAGFFFSKATNAVSVPGMFNFFNSSINKLLKFLICLPL